MTGTSLLCVPGYGTTHRRNCCQQPPSFIPLCSHLQVLKLLTEAGRVPNRPLTRLLHIVAHVAARVAGRLAHDLGDLCVTQAPSPRRIVELLGPVGRADEQHTRCAALWVAALHLDEHLRLEPPAGLVFALRFAGREDRVDLVNEDDRRLKTARHGKERLDHLLALADPLAGQRAGTYAEECCADVARDGLAQERLAGAGRPKQQYAAWRRACAGEQLRVEHRPHHNLLHEALGMLLACDIIPGDAGRCINFWTSSGTVPSGSASNCIVCSEYGHSPSSPGPSRAFCTNGGV
eukprot:362200-Chlamydomonas_euryale.AAC.15